MKIAVIAVVAVFLLAGVAVFFLNGNTEEEDELQLDGNLPVMGNADNDYKIDSKDLDIVEKVAASEEGFTLAAYPKADANNDGKVDQADKDLINKILNKEKCRVYVINNIPAGPYVDWCNWPVKNAVITGTSPFVTLCKVAGIMDHVRGASFYPQWGLDPLLFPELSKKPSIGKGANFFDFETVSQMKTTEGVDTILTQSWIPKEKDQFNEIGIGIVLINSKEVSVEKSTSSMLLLGFLFDEPNQSLEISKWYQDVKKYVDGKLKDVEPTKFMLSIGLGKISAELDYYTELYLAAGGVYADELKGTTKSTPIGDWMYDTKVDCIVGCLSSVAGDSWYNKDMDLQPFKEIASQFKDTQSFKDGKFYATAMNAPVPIKFLYAAVSLHPDIFTVEWADGLHKEFCEKYYQGDYNFDDLDFFLTTDELV